MPGAVAAGPTVNRFLKHAYGPPPKEEIIGLCASAPEQVADRVVALYQQVQTHRKVQ